MQASQSWSGSSASHWGNKADFKQTEALKRAPPVVALHTTTCAKIVVWMRDFWVKHAKLKIWFKKKQQKKKHEFASDRHITWAVTCKKEKIKKKLRGVYHQKCFGSVFIRSWGQIFLVTLIKKAFLLGGFPQEAILQKKVISMYHWHLNQLVLIITIVKVAHSVCFKHFFSRYKTGYVQGPRCLYTCCKSRNLTFFSFAQSRLYSPLCYL